MTRLVGFIATGSLVLITCGASAQDDQSATQSDRSGTPEKIAVLEEDRVALAEPGPMIPPVPAIVLGVKGNDRIQDDLSIVWTFVVEGNPPMIGISVPTHSAISGDRYVALDLIKEHQEFTLNVPDESWVTEFDQIDMTASSFSDKFADNKLTRLRSTMIAAPGIAEAAIVLECKVAQSHFLPPKRTVFFAKVLRTSVHPGVTDKTGRLISESRNFFGMTSGNGEFWTFGKKVGHIGMTKRRTDIKY